MQSCAFNAFVYQRATAALLQALKQKCFVCAVRAEKDEFGHAELHLVALFDPTDAADGATADLPA
jgi:hypothetical protein